MIERVVENWLNRVNERSFEIPFCQLLAGEGFQVVHLSRHGPAEEGKDILAIADDGTPCAFQLKSGNITLKAWEKLKPQVERLVEVPIIHPSIDSGLPRRVFFVTTGELDEEVRTEIDHRNRDWEKRGHPRLEITVKGQLLDRFKKTHTNFWPIELDSEKSLLEFFLAEGTEYLDKGKLATFVLSLLPIFDEDLNKAECGRSLISAAILTTYSLSRYAEQENHVALIEGWVVYLACLIALVEKHNLERTYWKEILEISMSAVERAFLNLFDELQSRTDLVEGHALVDSYFYRGRVTWLIGLVSAFSLWQMSLNSDWSLLDWSRTFVQSNKEKLVLWGEAAIPHFLAAIWFLRNVTGISKTDIILASLIKTICAINQSEHSNGLPNPYRTLAEVVSDNTGIADSFHREYYRGRSYTMEGLVHLFARRNWRQQMRSLWPEITHIEYAEFRPETAWQFCLWRLEEHGQLRISYPNTPQSWSELRNDASEFDTTNIPRVFQENPGLFLVFLIVYPHRFTKDAAKFLDEQL